MGSFLSRKGSGFGLPHVYVLSFGFEVADDGQDRVRTKPAGEEP